ncbi:hypothetical protein BASA84_000044 [Batrachochytrium salamandrivorans]|nr:hypothetical protein BASA84_000044 [Batrachochytrium salamandrivorans]
MRTGAGAINLVANVTRDLYVEANTGYIQISAAFVEPLLPHTSQLARTAEIVSNGGWVRGHMNFMVALSHKPLWVEPTLLVKTFTWTQPVFHFQARLKDMSETVHLDLALYMHLQALELYRYFA